MGKMILFGAGFVILALLEASVINLPFVLILVVCMSFYVELAQIMWVALMAGLVADLVLTRTMGVTALFFLTTVFITGRYRKKWEIKHWAVRGLIFTIIVIFYHLSFRT